MRIVLTVVVVLAVVLAAVLWMRACGRGGTPETALTSSDAGERSTEAESGPGAAGDDGRLIDVGGHRLHVRTYGTGTPSVVIEPGIGDAGRVWGGVIDALSAETAVVLYARAGYAQSDPGPMPRSADRVVRELSRMLEGADVDAPYIVAGHSLGAMHALLYASEHQNQVDGLVLLDPPPMGFLKGERFPELIDLAERMTAGFRSDAQRARADGNEREAAFLESVASEHEAMFETGWTWMASVKSLGDMPLVVMASGVPNPEFGASAAEFQRFWRDSSEQLSRLSTRGRFVYVADSTHDLPGDATDDVVEAILWCIAASENLPEYEIWQGEK